MCCPQLYTARSIRRVVSSALLLACPLSTCVFSSRVLQPTRNVANTSKQMQPPTGQEKKGHMQGTTLTKPQHNQTTGETMSKTNPTFLHCYFFLSEPYPLTSSTRMNFAPFPYEIGDDQPTRKEARHDLRGVLRADILPSYQLPVSRQRSPASGQG